MNAGQLVHHELCFGCGRTNLFGLLMDVERVSEGVVKGRGFIKQDHQGAVPGRAHDGIILAALGEAMAFACGPGTQASRIELDLEAPALVGEFLDVEAHIVERTDEVCRVAARASVAERQVASAQGRYYRR